MDQDLFYLKMKIRLAAGVHMARVLIHSQIDLLTTAVDHGSADISPMQMKNARMRDYIQVQWCWDPTQPYIFFLCNPLQDSNAHLVCRLLLSATLSLIPIWALFFTQGHEDILERQGLPVWTVTVHALRSASTELDWRKSGGSESLAFPTKADGERARLGLAIGEYSMSHGLNYICNAEDLDAPLVGCAIVAKACAGNVAKDIAAERIQQLHQAMWGQSQRRNHWSSMMLISNGNPYGWGPPKIFYTTTINWTSRSLGRCTVFGMLRLSDCRWFLWPAWFSAGRCFPVAVPLFGILSKIRPLDKSWGFLRVSRVISLAHRLFRSAVSLLLSSINLSFQKSGENPENIKFQVISSSKFVVFDGFYPGFLVSTKRSFLSDTLPYLSADLQGGTPAANLGAHGHLSLWEPAPNPSRWGGMGKWWETEKPLE